MTQKVLIITILVCMVLVVAVLIIWLLSDLTKNSIKKMALERIDRYRTKARASVMTGGVLLIIYLLIYNHIESYLENAPAWFCISLNILICCPIAYGLYCAIRMLTIKD